jgi:hypothetical protein
MRPSPFNDNDKMLNELDVQGVALAAIQGLNQKLEESLRAKEAEMVQLKQRLQAVEKLLELGTH